MNRFIKCILSLILVIAFTSCSSGITEPSETSKKFNFSNEPKATYSASTKPAVGHNDDDDDEVKNQRTVYVSRKGKIHTNPRCSGMKYYTEMYEDDAINKGYDFCNNCY